MEIIKGISLLLCALTLFSLFSLKMPKGDKAMSGLANAAVATFLVEAIHKYIAGGIFGSKLLENVGIASGESGGIAAVSLVGISMGINPVFAIAAGVAVNGYGILPGFVAGYLVSLIAPKFEKYLPNGIDVIAGALIIAPISRIVAAAVDPIVTLALGEIGNSITLAANQSPIVMGFLLGGIIKMICTSPLSSMALTAMLGLTGLPMGIAAVASFGGAFSDGVVFKRLKLGASSSTLSVMLEPLTQANIISANALPIYSSNFLGGGLAGISAAAFHIVNNAPGTASPIPGLLAPFAFNAPHTVILALIFAALGGTAAGILGSGVYLWLKDHPRLKPAYSRLRR